MTVKRVVFFAVVCTMLCAVISSTAQTQQGGIADRIAQDAIPSSTVWSAERAHAWYEERGWLVGCNYIPSTAINQLEMWQAETFDASAIDRELGWAEALGFNSVRVYLHDLLWRQDAAGLQQRIEAFLEMADRHGIGVIFVLLDGVWDPNPEPGPQPAPRPYVHNSGWVQSPGAEVLKDESRWHLIEDYVKGVVGRFHEDPRIHGWDVFNEPENENRGSYGDQELENKQDLAFRLLKEAFRWVREAQPTQPVTAAPWQGDWANPDAMSEISRFMFENSDIVTFHSYEAPDRLKERALLLQRYKKPILCTEYMARTTGSTFQNLLRFMKEHQIGAFNWGFVSGKTQTIYPWDSWRQTYTAEPEPWFHDILRMDGTPYSEAEVRLIQSLTGVVDAAMPK